MSNNTMVYKGYVGTVEYSAEDGCFIGHIHGIRDIILFEGESVGELRTDFENAVKSYLATCEEIGKIPQKQDLGELSFSIPINLYQELAEQSANSGESVNSLVVEAVETLCKSGKRSVSRSGAAKGGARRRKAGAVVGAVVGAGK